MRTSLTLTLLFLIVAAAHGQEKPTDEPPVPLEKWDFSLAEKMWGLKVKSVTYKGDDHQYTFIVEQMKDLTPEELKAVQGTFPQIGTSQTANSMLAFYFFDKDNVLLKKEFTAWAVTEITGTKGDAFRMRTYHPTETRGGTTQILPGVVKVELRQLR